MAYDLARMIQELERLRGRRDYAQVAGRLLARVQPPDIPDLPTREPALLPPPHPPSYADPTSSLPQAMGESFSGSPDLSPPNGAGSALQGPQGEAETVFMERIKRIMARLNLPGLGQPDMDASGMEPLMPEEQLGETIPPPQPQLEPEPAPQDPDAYIDALRAALLGQESGGDMGVRGQEITQGSDLIGERAMGGFQIMPGTARDLMERFPALRDAVPGGDLEQALMASPEAQERFMAANLAYNAQRIGSADPSALILAHYGGPGAARRYLRTGEMSDDPIMTTGRENPSHRQYTDEVLGRLGEAETPPLEAFIAALLARAGIQ